MPIVSEIRAELRLHADVQSVDDEWSGITNPVIRRKLQNRLNQRAARRRKASQKGTSNDVPSTSSDASATRSRPLARQIDLHDAAPLQVKSLNFPGTKWRVTEAESVIEVDPSAFVSIRSKHTCQRWYEVLLENRLAQIKDLAGRLQIERENAWKLTLPADHLISLVYYNVYRGLLANVEVLGLDLNLMYTDEYPSPFLPLSSSASSNLRRLPPGLQPTELQKSIAHHPQWDIFPDPMVRDNILRYGESNIDDYEFCLDLVGNGNFDNLEGCSTQEKNGLICWGEPWDMGGWEVTEAFARKYPFILRGALNFQQCSNEWRVKRGEEPLDFERVLEIE
ncbi:hypothetical protein EDD37DRAFT_644927 [Exophiala viscosa]|uniref:uncharacterized protein n=1 Tax=Exophiala viscosa TaxID=2486360 RepID=UPI00218EBC9C|nr:hypothetical protein EDD37DRAFT_644927 [Exophiala viscosa]